MCAVWCKVMCGVMCRNMCNFGIKCDMVCVVCGIVWFGVP